MDKNDRDYSNGEITVHWRPSKCIHSTICYTRLRKVFDPSRRPWIKMDGASTEEIIDIVNQCPTDALTFSNDTRKTRDSLNDAQKQDTDASANIQIIHNGPAIISGDFNIIDIKGNKLAKADRVALCRCGKSSTEPFCDGTHNKIRFEDNRD